jgi:phenylacetic acid degradation protein
MPQIHPAAFIAPTAVVLGEVTLAEESSVWYGAVLRGDMAPIRIGAQTNIQDGTVVHVDEEVPCTVGDRVSVGHRAILHGCIIERNALIGMNAVINDSAVIGESSIVAAMAFVKARMVVPPRVLVAGMPARVIRELTETELAWKIEGTQSYQELARRSLATMQPTAPLAAVEPDRKRIELPELLPLSAVKAQSK